MPIGLINKTHLKISGILFITVLCFPFLSWSQSKKTGSIEYLKFCNGLSDIKLGSDINQIPQAKLAYLDGDSRFDADSCLRYEYRDDDILSMGDDLNLDLVGIRAYKGKVVDIYLFFRRADGYKVLSKFLTAYGPFTSKPDNFSDNYSWNSSLLNLSLKYEIKTDLGMAVLTSRPLADEIAAAKEKARKRKELEELVAKYTAFVSQAFSSVETSLPVKPTE